MEPKLKFFKLILSTIQLNIIESEMNKKQQQLEQSIYDNYGFKTTVKREEPNEEQQRIDIWQKILAKGMKNQTKQQIQLIKKQVRKGIPDKLRPQVWMKLIVPPCKQFQSIIVKKQLTEIDRDIDRTLPPNKRQVQIKVKLKNMLNVLATTFPDMGYCQGLNFMVANLLIILNQKQTFNVMFHILYWQKHQKLMGDLKRIYMKLYTLQKLIQKHYPKLCKHLNSFQMPPVIFATSWFITLFNSVLPCSYIFRILEIYYLEGQKILYRVALQILKQKKTVLKRLQTQQDIMNQFKSYEEFKNISIDKFFKEMFEINLSRKEIQNYQNQYVETHSQRQ